MISFGLIHHEHVITGMQALYPLLAFGWTAIGYAVYRIWRKKK